MSYNFTIYIEKFQAEVSFTTYEISTINRLCYHKNWCMRNLVENGLDLYNQVHSKAQIRSVEHFNEILEGNEFWHLAFAHFGREILMNKRCSSVERRRIYRLGLAIWSLRHVLKRAYKYFKQDWELHQGLNYITGNWTGRETLYELATDTSSRRDNNQLLELSEEYFSDKYTKHHIVN